MSKESKAVSFDPDDIIREEEEFKAKMAERREAALATVLEDIERLKEKARKLGWEDSAAPVSRGRKAKEPQEDSERRVRTCPRCSQVGHAARTCTNEPTAEWLASDRGRDFEKERKVAAKAK